jgi:hypothetical protein
MQSFERATPPQQNPELTTELPQAHEELTAPLPQAPVDDEPH